MSAELKENILDKVESFCRNILENELPNTIFFHDLDHTLFVLNAAKEIAKKSKLSEEDLEVVSIAAWFHDTGYSESTEYHEEMSVQNARLFLFQNGYSPDRIKKVIQCIRATKYPQMPSSMLEKVICDADLAHLSSSDFFEITEKLRNEVCAVNEFQITEREWLLTNKDFFKAHKYHTEYAKSKFESGKEKNLKIIQHKIVEMREDEAYLQSLKEQEAQLKKRFNKNKQQKPGRGIETMIRVTSKNHISLSQMADNKANILISVNAIILSVVISVLVRKFEESPYLVVPTLVLVLTCLVAIVFAVLSTRPNVSKGKFNREDIENRKTNLLFFGNFHGSNLEDYMWGMKEMMKSGEYLYSSLVRDIYFIGKVLGKKYNLLRFSYYTFMFGLVASVLLYLIAGYINYLNN